MIRILIYKNIFIKLSQKTYNLRLIQKLNFLFLEVDIGYSYLQTEEKDRYS